MRTKVNEKFKGNGKLSKVGPGESADSRSAEKGMVELRGPQEDAGGVRRVRV